MLREMLPGWYPFRWFPFQRCIECRKWYFGGLPWFGWLPAWREFCCRECCDKNMDRVDDYHDALRATVASLKAELAKAREKNDG